MSAPAAPYEGLGRPIRGPRALTDDWSRFWHLTYNIALNMDRLQGVNMDAVLAQFHLDAIVSATDNPAWSTDLLYGDHFIFGTSSLAAAQGYPIVQVPAGAVFGVPFGISFFGTAFRSSGGRGAESTQLYEFTREGASVPKPTSICAFAR